MTDDLPESAKVADRKLHDMRRRAYPCLGYTTG